MKFGRWSKAVIPALVLALGGCSDGGSDAIDANVGQRADAPTAAGETAQGAKIPVMGPERRILAFGDSLFAGYGLNDKDASYPSRLQAALRARGVNAQVTNAGVSGDTTAAGLQRFAFTLDAQDTPPDLVIVELGGNDLLRQISPDQTRANLDAILTQLKDRGIPAVLMGMRAPPNFGPEYQRDFDQLYADLARKHGAALVPFFLDSIYRDPKNFQSDRIHPTAPAIEILVGATIDTVAEALPSSDGPAASGG